MKAEIFDTPTLDVVTLVGAAALVVLLPAALATGLTWLAKGQTEALRLGGAVTLFAALAGLPLYWLCCGRATLTVGDAVRLGAGLYRLDESRTSVVPSSAVIFDRKDAFAGERALSIRTNGVGLPGYSLGWFMRQHGQRAFVWMGRDPVIVWFAIEKKYPVAIGFKTRAEAERFVASLHLGR